MSDSSEYNINDATNFSPEETSNFTTSELYSEIESASEKHKNQQLNFRFKSTEMLKLLKHLEKNPETEKLIESVFKDALDKSDKRPMTEQLNLKAKYQKSHGLVFKDIPIGVQRHVIFDAILKLGRTMDFETGRLAFPGGCKLRSFFFPQIKHREQQHRVCFPIFVNKRDQMFIYQWAQNQDGKIQLDVDKNCGWDGIVAVELTRDASADDEDTESVASGVSMASRASRAMSSMSGFSNFKRYDAFGNPVQNPVTNNPLSNGFSPQNPFLQYLPFTHGGPMSPNMMNPMTPNMLNHPNLISHQNMLQNQMSAAPVMSPSPALTAVTTPVVQSKTEAISSSLNSLSLKDSEYSPSPTPEQVKVEPIC